MEMSELAERVRKVIRNNRYLTLATTDGKSAWIAPLAYYVEPEYTFVYYSGMNSVHSQHIKRNPKVACSIYDSSLPSDEVDGIQFSAVVEDVSVKELPHVAPRYFAQSFPIEEIRKKWFRPFTDFKGFAVQRFYRIRPTKIFTIDLESIKVDKRVEVDLTEIMKVPMMK